MYSCQQVLTIILLIPNLHLSMTTKTSSQTSPSTQQLLQSRQISVKANRFLHYNTAIWCRDTVHMLCQYISTTDTLWSRGIYFLASWHPVGTYFVHVLALHLSYIFRCIIHICHEHNLFFSFLFLSIHEAIESPVHFNHMFITNNISPKPCILTSFKIK